VEHLHRRRLTHSPYTTLFRSEAIGKTPTVRINNIFGKNTEVWMKLERQNPGGSIKDRIALAMIEKAESEGKITKDTLIVEPTSGNTGVGLAMVCAVKGYQLDRKSTRLNSS